MKKMFLVIGASIFGSFFSQHNVFAVNDVKQPIVLVSPIMNVIDGKSFAINGNVFGLILKSRKAVRDRLFGIVADASKSESATKKIGHYEFDGKKYNLVELVEIEKESLEKSKCGDLAAKAKLDALKNVLNFAKEDFINITKEYLDSAKGMKGPLLIIIEEFHAKSGLGEFFLLDWGKTTDGGEMDSMKKNVKSLNDLKVLFIEMEGFLEAMARSCPKGKKLFVEMVSASKQK